MSAILDCACLTTIITVSSRALSIDLGQIIAATYLTKFVVLITAFPGRKKWPPEVLPAIISRPTWWNRVVTLVANQQAEQGWTCNKWLAIKYGVSSTFSCIIHGGINNHELSSILMETKWEKDQVSALCAFDLFRMKTLAWSATRQI
jgi:hypothetical protein